MIAHLSLDYDNAGDYVELEFSGPVEFSNIYAYPERPLSFLENNSECYK